MSMHGQRYRCYPTPTQAQTLLRWIGCQRFIYNAKVAEDRYFRTFARKALAFAGQHAPIDQQYSHFKTEQTPWLGDVPSQVLRNGAKRWKDAYGRFFKKLARRPTLHGKGGAQSVWLTSELFRFEEDGQGGHRLLVGTKRHPVGVLRYVADRPHDLPASIVVSVEAGRWHVSFATKDEAVYPRPDETLAELSAWSEDDLLRATVGVDRGVANPAYASTGAVYDFDPVQKARMARKARQRKRWQRRMARRAKGSSGWRKAKRQVAKTYTYASNVRRDFAHKTSLDLVSQPGVRLLVLEDIKIQNMTRRSKAKKDVSGRWTRNGAKTKAGLNRSILQSAWGRIRTYAQYKAPRHNVLCLVVPPHHSSQECAACGHIHPDNRLTQSRFVCQRCGHADHADSNASRVIARRGVQAVLGGCETDPQGVGAERPEPSRPRAVATPVETAVRRERASPVALGSSKPETAPTTATAV